MQLGSEIIRIVNNLTYLLFVNTSWASIKIQTSALKPLLFFCLNYELVKIKIMQKNKNSP